MDTSKYYNNDPYPVRPTKPVLKGQTSQDHRTYADELEKWEKLKKDYDDACDKWKKKQTDLHELFKQDVFDELAIKDHPKRNKLWEIAWDRGHGTGLADVYHAAEQMVVLIDSVALCFL